jgi:hypothetical protein
VCRLEVNWFGRVDLLITSVGDRVVCRLGVHSQPAHDTATNTE